MKYKDYLNENQKFDTKTMLGIMSLILIISGLFGFIYEVIFYYFNGGMKLIYWRGANFLPWIDIYALGSLLIYKFTYKYRKKPLKVFLISSITCGVLEYLAGLLIYIIRDGHRSWNYNTEILNFGNINGFICLRSVLFFGISALLLIYVIIPLCFYLAKHMNRKVFLTITLVLISIILIDEVYNLVIARITPLPNSFDIYIKHGMHYMTFN